jgi:hypothetical protein
LSNPIARCHIGFAASGSNSAQRLGSATFELSFLSGPNARGGRFVAAAKDGKAYASFHLMPIYAFPALRRLMQGKSCFNFTRIDEPLLVELAELMERGFARYRTLDLARLRAEASAKRRG